MPPRLKTTDRYNMAEHIQVSAALCCILFNVRRIFDTSCHSSDYQRAQEIT